MEKCIEDLHDYPLLLILKYLPRKDIQNIFDASTRFRNLILSSTKLKTKLMLTLDANFLSKILKDKEFLKLQFRYVCIKNLHDTTTKEKVFSLLNEYRNTIEYVMLESCYLNDANELYKILHQIPNLREVEFNGCRMRKPILAGDVQKQLTLIKSVLFQDCCTSMYKFFKEYKSIEKICQIAEDKECNGYPFEEFHDLANSLRNINHIKLVGVGTIFYFLRKEFRYRIMTLEAHSITYHWYNDVRGARNEFLDSQTGSLRKLCIKELPYDFEGGSFLKTIIEEMQLNCFYYGNIPLITNGQKQKVLMFTANQFNIHSAFEMFRQFKGIKSFQLNLYEEYVESDEIKNSIKALSPNLFSSLKDFKIVDECRWENNIVVFKTLFEKFSNLEKLSIKSQNKNVKVILEDYLHHMTSLKEIQLDSTAPGAVDRFKIIKYRTVGIEKLIIPKELIFDAQNIFGNGRVTIVALDKNKQKTAQIKLEKFNNRFIKKKSQKYRYKNINTIFA